MINKINHKTLLAIILALATACTSMAQRMSIASNQVSSPSDISTSSFASSTTTTTGSSTAMVSNTENSLDPLEPGGEIEDPLAPVRNQIGTTRSAFGPDRSQTGKDDEWSVELAAEYGYVWNASLSNAQGNINEESGIIGLLGSKRLDEVS